LFLAELPTLAEKVLPLPLIFVLMTEELAVLLKPLSVVPPTIYSVKTATMIPECKLPSC